jgi:bacterioferritin-associated ferredoxin
LKDGGTEKTIEECIEANPAPPRGLVEVLVLGKDCKNCKIVVRGFIKKGGNWLRARRRVK